MSETTFRSFTNEQGANYAQNRKSYSYKLFELLIKHHISTGGQLDTVLDVGCGPGIATHDVASHFEHVIGLDPSEGMIATARSLGGSSKSSEPIRFELSTAEELGSNLDQPIAAGSVDLITAATAAHWFDMSKFWSRAAQVLRPGGTVAIWTSRFNFVHPSMPNRDAVQALADEFHDKYIRPYAQPGSMLSQNLYVDLPLPWTLDEPVAGFDQETFYRREWTGEYDSDRFFADQAAVDLDTMEKMYSTASSVVRWREAHSDAAGTERDVLRIFRRSLEKLLHEAGVEHGKEWVRGSVGGVLLMVKKKA
ncbi:S-adenosyl-L-methionine-dependent methyltransferase [Pseudomassariella vexata]|uniref:S-adenosyl-L-methionine-dependent methyltransferase n=1 Tax=Pseudomassariella vexata TaxID=1141098 RepID=A0A1Y2DVH5_9PEZI|nr:S-adenosyl-L-methionine-dependent methyltransferase [Pseudomassariella vexata]ORY63281.1 S-adenosyl-L-methionine-dependent methyltransferase [Pseudomassariella vexata]